MKKFQKLKYLSKVMIFLYEGGRDIRTPPMGQIGLKVLLFLYPVRDVVVLTCLQHIVFCLQLHGRYFSSTFSFAVLLMMLLMIVFPPIISPRFLVRLKDITGSPSNVLADFLMVGCCLLIVCKTFYIIFIIFPYHVINVWKVLH